MKSSDNPSGFGFVEIRIEPYEEVDIRKRSDGRSFNVASTINELTNTLEVDSGRHGITMLPSHFDLSFRRGDPPKAFVEKVVRDDRYRHIQALRGRMGL